MGLTRLRAEQISDIDYKQAVRVITVANVTLSGGAPTPVDGVNLSAGDRVLVTGQSTGSQNGIYQVQTVGSGSNGTWIRSADTNATGELEAGTIVMVTEGTVYADSQWKLTTNNPIVIGTTALIFEQNSAFAFGNILANSTAVLATTVGSTVTFSPGSGIQITGNNTTKTVTIAATGTATVESISNGTSNVNVVSSGGNVTVGVGGSGNIAEFSTTGLRVTGIASATGNVTGGNVLTAGLISATSTITSAANVIGGNILTAGVITATGNIQGGNLRTVGLISATGSINLGGNLNFTNAEASDSAKIYANVSGADTSLVLEVSDDNASDKIVLRHFYFLSNTTVDMLSAQRSGNTEANVTITGNLIATNQVTATGNVIGGNIRTTGVITATGNVQGGNIRTAGLISATGDITGAAITGTAVTASTATGRVGLGTDSGGSLSLGFQANNASATSPYIDFNTSSVAVDFDVRIQASGNTAVVGAGTLTINAGLLSATGNIQGGNLRTTGLITATGNVTGGNVLSGGVVSATGNVTGGNLLTAGLVSATSTITSAANVIGGNISTAGLITATGNVQGGNLRTAGLISATGNLAAAFAVLSASNVFLQINDSFATATSVKNISIVSGLRDLALIANIGPGSYNGLSGLNDSAIVFTGNALGNANLVLVPWASATSGIKISSVSNVATITLAATTTSATGNVISGNISTAGLVTATGNVTGGNILTGGLVSATGNITGGNLLTAGLITATGTITSAANVTGGNITTAGVVSATANVTGGNLRTAGLISATGAITGASVVGGVMTGSSVSVTGAVTGASVVGGVMTGSSLSVTGTINGTTLTGTSLTVSTGNVSCGNIVNTNANGVGNIGSSATRFNQVFALASSAQYADLAEKYTADADYVPGTVLEFGGDQEVTATTTSHSPRVAGIVSTLPSYIMNDGLVSDHTAMVSLTGRVPCLVQGPIAKGDRLVASAVVGHAQRLDPAQYEPGCIIGKALEDYPSTAIGTIEVAVGRF